MRTDNAEASIDEKVSFHSLIGGSSGSGELTSCAAEFSSYDHWFRQAMGNSRILGLEIKTLFSAVTSIEEHGAVRFVQ